MQKQIYFAQTLAQETLVAIAAAKAYETPASFESNSIYAEINCGCQSTNLEVLMRPT